MADRFEDERGVIQDLLAGPIDSVTAIFTRAGHVRGNHVHPHTHQWLYVVDGELLVSHDGQEFKVHHDGALIAEPADKPHAWRAITDCHVLVFTQGPRSGENYESDTVRLPEEKWLLHSDPLCGACYKPGTAERPLSVISGGLPMHLACTERGE